MSDEPSRRKLFATFWIAVVGSLALGHVPFGGFVLYPFSVLGTWAHEMGHGIGALMVGGSFSHLELYANLGGVAYSSRPPNPLAEAFIPAAGLLGPAVVGGAIIMLGAHEKTATRVLDVLGIALLVSAVIWVRNGFGFVATVGLGVGILGVAHLAPKFIEIAITQFVGIRLCVEAVSSVDYMFTKNFTRGGQVMSSDTQAIAEVLLLPYWFWGGLIAVGCFAILTFSYWFAWVREN